MIGVAIEENAQALTIEAAGGICFFTYISADPTICRVGRQIHTLPVVTKPGQTCRAAAAPILAYPVRGWAETPTRVLLAVPFAAIVSALTTVFIVSL